MATTRTKPQPRRLTAEERRDEVIDAAIGAFSEFGYHATGTSEIARRAGVSQPYLYALFPDKRALFLACHERTTSEIAATLKAARESACEGEDLEVVLGRAYERMISTHRRNLLFQMHAYAAAASDEAIRVVVRERFVGLIEESIRLHGTSLDTVLGYIAKALYFNVTLALDLPPEYRLQH